MMRIAQGEFVPVSFLLVAALGAPPVLSTPRVVPRPITVAQPNPSWPDVRPGPITSSPDWSDYKNYPAEARQNEEEGSVRFGLLIDSSGKPVECAVLMSSGTSTLDDAYCNLAMQMRFEPGRGPDGKPVASSKITRVNWLLDDPRPFSSSALDAEILFDGSRMTDCVAKGSGPYAEPWKVAVCDMARTRPQAFASSGQLPSQVALSIRLDAGDSVMANPHWPKGKTIARSQISFTINTDGDASECSADGDGQVFGNDYRSQSPCGQFLSTIWFEEPAEGQNPRGQFELRLIEPGTE